MDLRCPRCALPLSSTSVEWVSACGRCGGIFAARTVGPVGAAVARAAEAASEGAAVRVATTSPVSCPACRRTASRERFRGIDVDRCADHGIWFDRDELVHALQGTKPRTMKGLGGAAVSASNAAVAADALGRPAALRGDEAIDLADVGLDAAVPAIRADLEASDAAAWMLVDMVTDLFDR